MKSLRLLLHLSILSIICITGTSIGHAQVNTNDSLALVAIYHATNGDQWKENTNWLTDKPVSEWFGITVENGRVSIVNLNKNDLSGYIPDDISKLTEMVEFAVESNENLTGQIPPSINKLAKVERLDFSRCGFSGPFPNISTMEKLSALYISGSGFSGDLDTILGYHPDLYYLSVHYNNFSGCVSAWHFNPEKIRYIDAHENQFTCLGDFSGSNIYVALNRVHVQGNKLGFEYMEPNMSSNGFKYVPQKPLLDEETLSVDINETVVLTSGSGGDFTHYQWFKDDAPIPGETSPELRLVISGIDEEGTYHCEMTNEIVTNITLVRSDVHIIVSGVSASSDVRWNKVQVYPNPATDFIRLEGIQEGIQRFRVYDANGADRTSAVTDQKNGNLDIRNLNPGLYTVIFAGNGWQSTGRFLKL